jgi:putative (di)nucleoside polyphosphate hydrolase
MANGKGPASDPIKKFLDDPLIRLVMTADRVAPEALDRELRDTLERRGALGRPVLGAADVEVGDAPNPDGPYRPAVGIVLLNARGEVFVARRIDRKQDGWQMPQGGMEPGESPLDAARRELREEIGTDDAEVIAESPGWLRYELPPHLVGKVWNGRWRGQQQKWFAMRFLGQDSDIRLATPHPEFSDWRWVPAARVPDLIVGFKHQLYLAVLGSLDHVVVANPEGAGGDVSG